MYTCIYFSFPPLQEVASHTRVPPNQRAHQMETFVNTLNSHPEVSKELEKWGLALELNNATVCFI